MEQFHHGRHLSAGITGRLVYLRIGRFYTNLRLGYNGFAFSFALGWD